MQIKNADTERSQYSIVDELFIQFSIPPHRTA